MKNRTVMCNAYLNIVGGIILLIQCATPGLYGEQRMHDIDEIKHHGETRDQRMKRKDSTLFKALFLGRPEKRTKSLHVITLEKAQELLTLLNERLLPARPDESKEDQKVRTARSFQKSISALTNLYARLEKDWAIEVVYSIYQIGFAFASFPHDEKIETLKTIATRPDKFDSAFFALFGINQFIKRMKQWERVDNRSIITKAAHKVRDAIVTLKKGASEQLERIY